VSDRAVDLQKVIDKIGEAIDLAKASKMPPLMIVGLLDVIKNDIVEKVSKK